MSDVLHLMSAFKMQRIELSLIDSHRMQPELRTGKAQISHLKRNVERSGFIAPPILSHRRTRYGALDGTRRITVARELGLVDLLCVVGYGLTAEQEDEMFIALNSANRAMGAADRNRALVRAPEKHLAACAEFLTGRQQDQFAGARDLLGPERHKELVESGHSISGLAGYVRRVQFWCGQYALGDLPAAAIADWCVQHRAMRLIDSTARHATKARCRAIVSAIRENRAFKGPKR